MFKFQGFNVGDLIRAQDFEDRPGRGPCYVEGQVTEVNAEGNARATFAHYVILATRDVWDGEELYHDSSRIGRRVNVPMETSMDWDGRVQRLHTGPQLEALLDLSVEQFQALKR